jgi:formate dehydrogenase subunit gamma
MMQVSSSPADRAAADAEAERLIEATRAILQRLAGAPGALLPILHAIQDELGYIPRLALPEVAVALNLSRAEVHGVVTYYHYFRSEPPGRHVVQICRAEACKAMGADALLAHAQHSLACQVHHTRADGLYSVDAVFCLGLCASSPAMLVDNELHARMTSARFDQLMARRATAEAAQEAR